MMTFDNQKLKDAREAQCLTLEALGEKVGVSAVAVWKWEQGRSSPSLRYRKALAKALKVPLSELRNGDQK